jgi:hypothetical protein
MPRQKRPRAGATPSAIDGSDLSLKAPVFARLLSDAVNESITSNTSSSYGTAAGQYVEWCEANGGVPFPVNKFYFGAWLVWKAMFVKVDSLGTYMAGVRWHHEVSLGFKWRLDSDAHIRKVMRYVKKRYGSSGKKIKVPITLDVVLLMARTLPGWPDLALMTHNDRVFVTASAIGVLGFLRGGEFLTSPACSRPLLLQRQVKSHADGVTVHVVRPKGQWWDIDAAVRCFTPAEGCPLDPKTLLESMRELSLVRLWDEGPAFRLQNGEPLSKAFMLGTTTRLLDKIEFEFTDSVGKKIDVRASSWRSGGVESARRAGISDPVIMAMGRWSTVAWERYSVASEKDMQGAAGRMWQEAERRADSGCRVAGSVDPAGIFIEDKMLGPSLSHVTRMRTGVSLLTTQAAPSQQVSEVIYPSPLQVGAVVKTRWGDAEIVTISDNGDLECRWDTWDGVYMLSGPSQ